MNDTLKVAGRIGAELGAAKAENDRLREALSRIANLPMYQCSTENDYRLSAAKAMAVGALTNQADPAETTEAYTARDMATAAAQGFRDGQAAVEQAAAQDERWAVHAQGPDELYAAFSREDAEQHAAALNTLSMPAGIQVSAIVVESPWPAAEHWKYLAEQERDHVAELRARVTRPAQTEQQPAYVECRECTDCGHVGINDAHQTDATCAMCDWSGPSPVEDQCPDCGKENAMGAACPKCSGRYRILAETHVAAPIAQTAPQGKFRMGDLVKKSTGSEWEGRVVGWYSTGQTPEGYAVESSAHRNSVQIYPVTALDAVE